MITVLVIFHYRNGNHLDAYTKYKELFINRFMLICVEFINSIYTKAFEGLSGSRPVHCLQ